MVGVNGRRRTQGFVRKIPGYRSSPETQAAFSARISDTLLASDGGAIVGNGDRSEAFAVWQPPSPDETSDGHVVASTAVATESAVSARHTHSQIFATAVSWQASLTSHSSPSAGAGVRGQPLSQRPQPTHLVCFEDALASQTVAFFRDTVGPSRGRVHSGARRRPSTR